MKRAACFVFAFLLQGQSVWARSHALETIDQYCKLVRNEMSGTTPFIFSGPDPWTELEEPPAEMPDEALAYVYTEGPDVRWVFLRIVDEEAGWSEDVHYYFNADGSIAKRERKLQAVGSNIELLSTTYYKAGEVLKEITHHHSLHKGKQDTSEFTDPDAPVYLNIDDLPFSDIPDLWRRIATANEDAKIHLSA